MQRDPRGEDNPPSGYYQISAPPSGVFLVWCDMRATGGWIRIGENDTSYAWIDRDEHNEDVALVTTYDLDMLQAVAASVGGFDDFDAACDIQFSMMADDSANDHRIYHRSIADLLKGGSAATGGAWPETSVHQSQGADNTRLYNRGVVHFALVHSQLAQIEPMRRAEHAGLLEQARRRFIHETRIPPEDPVGAPGRMVPEPILSYWLELPRLLQVTLSSNFERAAKLLAIFMPVLPGRPCRRVLGAKSPRSLH